MTLTPAAFRSLFPRQTKYRSVRTMVDGRAFDSKAEAHRYQELRVLERAGQIRDLRCQVSFDLTVKLHHIARYMADFVYVDSQDDRTIVEDVKGYRTDVYRMKRSLMLACYGIKILETR